MSDITNEWRELRQKLGELICRVDGMNISVDSKLKKLQAKEERQVELQEQIDEAYNKGIQDLYNAIRCLFAPCGRVPLIPVSDMRKLFGSVYAEKIIINKSPEEIIDKVNQWKAEKEKQAKEQEFHVGDEIICINECSMDYDKTYIYLDRDEYWMKMFDLDKMKTESTNNFVDYRKTGKHYDAIPILVNMTQP